MTREIVELKLVIFEGAEWVRAIYVDGVLYSYGDYYHEKISEKLEGWRSAFGYINQPYKLSSLSVTDESLCYNICELGHEPPKTLDELYEQQGQKTSKDQRAEDQH